MKRYAIIKMMQTQAGMPGVKLEAEQAFMDLEPIERATLLNAASHLCDMAISAILEDYPDEADEILERLEMMEIAAQPQVTN